MEAVHTDCHRMSSAVPDEIKAAFPAPLLYTSLFLWMFTEELAAHPCVSPADPVIPKGDQILKALTSHLPVGETWMVLFHCQEEQGLGRAAGLVNTP